MAVFGIGGKDCVHLYAVWVIINTGPWNLGNRPSQLNHNLWFSWDGRLPKFHGPVLKNFWWDGQKPPKLPFFTYFFKSKSIKNYKQKIKILLREPIRFEKKRLMDGRTDSRTARHRISSAMSAAELKKLEPRVCVHISPDILCYSIELQMRTRNKLYLCVHVTIYMSVAWAFLIFESSGPFY